MTPETEQQENPRTLATNLFFEQVRASECSVVTHTPVGEIGTHHWVAAVTYHFSKALPWHFDLQAFRQAMVSTAAVCLRAALWADEVMAGRRATVEAIRAQQQAGSTSEE